MAKDITKTDKDRANDILGYRSVIGLAVLVGLIGGFLFGIWDSITVIVDRGLADNASREMFFLFLYSVAIYTVIGCLGMAIIGAVSGSIIRAREYHARIRR